MPEVEVLPVCRHHGIGVVPYSPIARGVLSGKYLPGGKPKPGSRAARKDRRMMQTEYRPESLDIAQEILEYSSARGIEPVHFAVNWVLANSAITSVIVGAPHFVSDEIISGGIQTYLDPRGRGFC
ncbi:MAG: hypothetical protein CM1200mP4_5130 [Rhodospirillaceae bacterium]|nr:MAG: hypothetical protein CM1200mP4_5130 [Rhodospirillaceae bacterium]